jgi:hypothetical protein
MGASGPRQIENYISEDDIGTAKTAYEQADEAAKNYGTSVTNANKARQNAALSEQNWKAEFDA